MCRPVSATDTATKAVLASARNMTSAWADATHFLAGGSVGHPEGDANRATHLLPDGRGFCLEWVCFFTTWATEAVGSTLMSIAAFAVRQEKDA